MALPGRNKALSLLLALFLLTGCAGPAVPMTDLTEIPLVELTDEAVALSEGPAAIPLNVTASAPGTAIKKSSEAFIDYSHAADGYVTVCHTEKTDRRLKVQVKGPTTAYTYDLPAETAAAFPFSDGNGSYKVTLYKNAEGSKYAAVLSKTLEVTLKDEFAPFLHPNQFVDYSAAPNTVTKAGELTAGITDPLQKVEAVYRFVVKGMTYDREKARTVRSGYVPVLDQVLEAKSGICFDYAALMTGMLRSQGVPCKLVVGYAGTAYHAWISVYAEESGWVDGAVFFDGKVWQRMDPTYASSAGGSAAILRYIGDSSNYTAKYFY